MRKVFAQQKDNEYIAGSHLVSPTQVSEIRIPKVTGTSNEDPTEKQA